MRILGIDPGEHTSGVVLLDAAPATVGVSHVRVIWADKALPNERLLASLRLGTMQPYHNLGWTAVVLETLVPYGLSFGWSTLRTAELIGQIREAAAHHPPTVEVHELTRLEVLQTLFGRKPQNADSAVRELLLEEIGPKGIKASPGPTYGVSGHAWQALGAVWAHVKQDVKRCAEN